MLDDKFCGKMQVFWGLLFVLTGSVAFGKNIPKPVFENAPENFTNAGYIKLSWIWEAGENFETTPFFQLQQALDPGFSDAQTIYQGQDFASFRSGLKNGRYFYRVNATLPGSDTSGWSDPIQVQVKHHSMTLTYSLLALGAVVFLLTVFIVVQGARRS